MHTTFRRRRPTQILPAQLALAGLLAAGGIGGCTSAGGSDAGRGTVLRFGSAVSLTGEMAGEGKLTQDGYKYCQDVVNAHGGVTVGSRHLTLSISYHDDESSPTTSARIVQQFNDEGIKFILGPYGSAATEAVAPVAQRNGQIVADSAGADNTIFEHGYTQVFGVESPASNYAASIIDAIVYNAHRVPRSVAFVSADDSFSQEVARFGVEEARSQGLHVFPLITFPAGSTDLSSVVTRVRAEHPDLLIESGHLVEGIALVSQAAQLGLRVDGIGETVAPTDPGFVGSLGRLADGVISSTQWVDNWPGKGPYFGTAADYAEGFRAAFGFTPAYHPAEASAACLALVLAIEHAGTTDPRRVTAALSQLDVDSFYGRIHFAPNGQDATRTMAVVQIQHGKPVTVWPHGLEQAPLEWPAPRAP